MEDIQIGRQTRTKVSFVGVTAALTPLFPQDPNRIGILISGSGASNGRMGPSNLVTTTQGFRFDNAGNGVYIDLWIERHGEIVTRDWYAVSAGACTLMIIETFLLERDSEDLSYAK
jgi:hypothetical protein